MKKIFLFLAIGLAANISFGQHCESFDEKDFRRVYKSIKKYKTDKGRLIGSERYLLGTCITSIQMKELAFTFDEDVSRGEFIKKYFHSITDYEYIATVFEVFDKMSHALNVYEELRPGILMERGGIESTTVAMANEVFLEKLELVKLEKYSRDKQERIRVLFESDFLSLDQIETLMNEFRYNRDKMWSIKLLYPRCTEKDKYYRLAKSFEYERDREEVLALMN